VDAIVKQFVRAHIQNTGDRFRFLTLQSRYAAFIDLWDRGMRAREEGRSGPFVHKRKEEKAEPKKAEDRILHVAKFKNPLQEQDKLHDLDSLVRRGVQSASAAVSSADLLRLIKRSCGERGPRWRSAQVRMGR
jgi:hypothetical protein